MTREEAKHIIDSSEYKAESGYISKQWGTITQRIISMSAMNAAGLMNLWK